MGEPMNYDNYAEHYAYTREAVPWVVAPLSQAVCQLPAGATVVEIGSGTGNYLLALAEGLPGYKYHGFDLSVGMLQVARARSGRVEWTRGNADAHFPYQDGGCHLAFAVDVVHHLTALDIFFREAARILTPDGVLLVVTDSEQDIRARSLTRYFPEILPVELRRYPGIPVLHHQAANAGFQVRHVEAATGTRALDAPFLPQLEAKCSSAMRLIPAEAHRQGMERVRQASDRGEQWHSCYTVITYGKSVGRAGAPPRNRT